jgi:hypothetical protein
MFKIFISLKNAVLAALRAFRAEWKVQRAAAKAAKAKRTIERNAARAAKAVRIAVAKELKARQIEAAKATKAAKAKAIKVERAQVEAIKLDKAMDANKTLRVDGQPGGWLRTNFIARAIGAFIDWVSMVQLRDQLRALDAQAEAFAAATAKQQAPKAKPHTANGRVLQTTGK